MSAYAIGHLIPADRPHDEVLDYLERIQATLDPYRGRFLVHGASVEVKEGRWPGTIVIIGFPGMTEARGWYDSAAYQELIPLRTRHLAGDTILVDGVPPGYDASVTAAKLRRARDAAA